MTHSIVPARVFNKKTAALALLLALSGFSPYLSAVTCNGETVNSTRPKAPNPENPYPNFGVHVYARTHISSTNCDWYATKNAETGNYETYPTGKTADCYNAATSDIDNLGRPIDLLSNVTANQTEFGGGSTVLRRNYGNTFADVSLGDTLWFDKPEAAADEVTHIPVKLCFEYSSRWTPETSTTSGTSAASTTIQVGRFDYNGIASQDSYTLDTNIAQVESGQWISQQCNSGSLDMTGPGAGYTLRLLLQNTGQTGQEVDSGTGTAMVTKDGALTGRFQISSLPGGVTCRSASGLFPGCDAPLVALAKNLPTCQPSPPSDPPKPDLKLSNIRVTQAVFGSDPNKDGTTDLVKDRETAVLVDVDVLQGNVADTVMLGGQYTDALGTEDEKTYSFQEIAVPIASGETKKEVALFFTPKHEGDLKISLEIDTRNKVDEGVDGEKNNSTPPVLADVRKTDDLKLSYVELLPPSEATYHTVSLINDYIALSTQFIGATYPVSNDGVIGKLSGSLTGSIRKDTVSDPKRTDTIKEDLKKIFMNSDGNGAKMNFGIVSNNYFKYHDNGIGVWCKTIDNACDSRGGIESCIGGVTTPDYYAAMIVVEGGWTTSAHELGHQLGLYNGKEAYDVGKCGASDPPEIYADGYWVKEKARIKLEDKIPDFMGTAPPTGNNPIPNPPPRWVTTETWNCLFKALSTEKTEKCDLIRKSMVDTPKNNYEKTLPVTNKELAVTGEFKNNGIITIDPIVVRQGFSENHKPGPNKIKVFDYKNQLVFQTTFNIWNQFIPILPQMEEQAKAIDLDFGYFMINIPYFESTGLIVFEGKDGNILFEFDPLQKILIDAVNLIPDQCFLYNPIEWRRELKNILDSLNQLISDTRYDNAIRALEEELIPIVEQYMVDNCEIINASQTTKKEILELIDDTVKRLNYRLDPTSVPCESSLTVEPGRCAGNYQAYSLDDLQAYVSAAYGRDMNPKGHYMNLQIMGNLDAEELLIETPCKVSVAGNILLSGTQSVKVDGQLGITGKNGIRIDTPAACILSGQGKVTMGANLTATTKTFNVDAVGNVKIGKNAAITANDRTSIQSVTGQSSLEAQSRIDGEKIRIIGNAVSIGKAAVLNALDTLHVEAMAPEKCTISDTAALNGASISGNCLEPQPATVQEQ